MWYWCGRPEWREQRGGARAAAGVGARGVHGVEWVRAAAGVGVVVDGGNGAAAERARAAVVGVGARGVDDVERARGVDDVGASTARTAGGVDGVDAAGLHRRGVEERAGVVVVEHS